MSSANNLPSQAQTPLPDFDPSDPDAQKPIARWNWGAFFFHWIWGLCNGCPVALWWFFPVIGPIVMPFVLGAKGNEWSWENKDWGTATHFHRVQRNWALAGFILILINATVFVVTAKTGFFNDSRFKIPRISQFTQFASHSEKPVFDEALVKLKQDNEILKEFGAPLKIGKILRLKKKPQENQKENILAEFEIIGSLKTAVVYADSTVDTGVVFFNQLVIYFQNPSRKVWEVPYYRDKPETV